VRFEVLAGTPGAALRRFAQEQDMDLLVVEPTPAARPATGRDSAVAAGGAREEQAAANHADEPTSDTNTTVP
jgi:hypothetical protein